MPAEWPIGGGPETDPEATPALAAHAALERAGNPHGIGDELDDLDVRLDAFDASLTAGLASKAALAHGHVIADVTGLQAALDALTDPTELSTAITAAINAHAAGDATDEELTDAIAAEVVNRDAAVAAAVASLTGDINAVQAEVDAEETARSNADIFLNAALGGKASIVQLAGMKRVLRSGGGRMSNSAVGGTNYLLTNAFSDVVATSNPTAAGAAGTMWYVEHDDFPAISGYNRKLRIRILAQHQATVQNVTWDLDLSPFTISSSALVKGTALGTVAFAASEMAASVFTRKETLIDLPADGSVVAVTARPGGTPPTAIGFGYDLIGEYVAA